MASERWRRRSKIAEAMVASLLKVSGQLLKALLVVMTSEPRSMIITTNKPFKKWPEIFKNDAGITSAILDRILHGAETVVIEGKSFRMKDQTDPPPAAA